MSCSWERIISKDYLELKDRKMIRPEIPEEFALLNYHDVIFKVDNDEEAIASIKDAVKKLTGYEHEILLKKSFISKKFYLSLTPDPKNFQSLFEKRIFLYSNDDGKYLGIQIRRGNKNIEYTLELASEIYKKIKYDSLNNFLPEIK
ncbi:MAG: hypothetical protein KatS3mg002_0673 [Candidatus Woesearchaeota archaeon]|nr:MAG: hypothetical protein KatS3mg002_0673 [Candidatus Woesearchaeota archaeon]